MCWNKEVSLFTFAIVCITSYNLFQRQLPYDILYGFFIFSYGLMQLFEAMMWIGQPCNNFNIIGSILDSTILCLTPLIFASIDAIFSWAFCNASIFACSFK